MSSGDHCSLGRSRRQGRGSPEARCAVGNHRRRSRDDALCSRVGSVSSSARDNLSCRIGSLVHRKPAGRVGSLEHPSTCAVQLGFVRRRLAGCRGSTGSYSPTPTPHRMPREHGELLQGAAGSNGGAGRRCRHLRVDQGAPGAATGCRGVGEGTDGAGRNRGLPGKVSDGSEGIEEGLGETLK